MFYITQADTLLGRRSAASPPPRLPKTAFSCKDVRPAEVAPIHGVSKVIVRLYCAH